jgi:hypothetical protein
VRKLTTAAVGSVVFFIAAPGVVAGLMPWLISDWDVCWPMSAFGIGMMALGVALLAVAVMVLIRNFARSWSRVEVLHRQCCQPNG